jgi:hypothetical protein
MPSVMSCSLKGQLPKLRDAAITVTVAIGVSLVVSIAMKLFGTRVDWPAQPRFEPYVLP